MGIVGWIVESVKYRARRRPVLRLKQQPGYKGSDSYGAYYAVYVRNDGGSIARDVEVVLVLDDEGIAQKTVSVAKEEEVRVRLGVPVERCEASADGSWRAAGRLRFEARMNGRTVAGIDSDNA